MEFIYFPYTVSSVMREHRDACDKISRMHFLADLANLHFDFIRYFLPPCITIRLEFFLIFFLMRQVIVHYTLVLNL